MIYGQEFLDKNKQIDDVEHTCILSLTHQICYGTKLLGFIAIINFQGYGIFGF